TGGGGPAHVKVLIRSPGKMVGGDGRFDGGEDEDLAVGADLEDGAAAIADVKVVLMIESQTRGHTHALHEDGHVAIGADLINHAVEPAGDVDITVAAHSDGRGVHHIVDERRRIEI